MTRATACRRGYDRRWRALAAEAIARQPWCSVCGATTDLTGDHIIPVSRGGLTTRANVQVLCRSCNSIKSARVRRTQLSLDDALSGLWAPPAGQMRDTTSGGAVVRQESAGIPTATDRGALILSRTENDSQAAIAGAPHTDRACIVQPRSSIAPLRTSRPGFFGGQGLLSLRHPIGGHGTSPERASVQPIDPCRDVCKSQGFSEARA